MSRKLTPYSKLWYGIARNIAVNYAPTFYPCAKCNYPVMSGYCCTGCGDVNPSQKDEQPDAD